MGAFGATRAALALAHFDAQEFGEDGDAASDLFFVEAGKAEAQGVGERRLHVEITARSEEDAALPGVDHEFAGIKAGGQFEPEAHATFGTRPARAFGHEFTKGLIESLETVSVDLAHAREMLMEKAAAKEFGERGLGKLVGVEIGHLLDQAEPFDGGGRRDNPADAEAGESDLGEAVNVNDEIGLIELFERRNANIAGVQARVDVVFDNGNLVAGGEFQKAATGIEGHGSAGRILKIGSEDEQLDAIGGECCFQGFEVDAKRLAGFGVGAHGNTEAARANAMENGGGAGIGGIFEDDGVARAHKGFGDEVESLLTTSGDKKSFVLGGDAVVVEKFEERLLEGRVTVGGAEIEDFGAFAAEGSVRAGLQFFHGEKLGSGARHDEGERVLWSRSGEAGENFFAAFIGEEKFPAKAIAIVEGRWRGRRNLQAIAIGADKSAAANMALNEALGFKFGVGVGDGGAVNAKGKGEFAAGGDAIAGAKIASVDQGTKLVAKLDVEWDVGFRLKV